MYVIEKAFLIRRNSHQAGKLCVGAHRSSELYTTCMQCKMYSVQCTLVHRCLCSGLSQFRTPCISLTFVYMELDDEVEPHIIRIRKKGRQRSSLLVGGHTVPKCRNSYLAARMI